MRRSNRPGWPPTSCAPSAERAPAYAAVIADGIWLSPGREAMDLQNAAVQADVTAAVRIKCSRARAHLGVAALDHRPVPRSMTLWVRPPSTGGGRTRPAAFDFGISLA